MKASFVRKNPNGYEDSPRYVQYDELVSLSLRISELPTNAKLDRSVQIVADGKSVAKDARIAEVESIEAAYVDVVVAAKELGIADREQPTRVKIIVKTIGDGGDVQVDVLAVPAGHARLARWLGRAAMAIAAVGALLLWISARSHVEQIIHVVTGATGAAVIAVVAARANSFKLPRFGIETLVSRAVLALIAAPLLLVIPRFGLVRIRNATDHTFTIRSGTSKLTVAPGWTVTHRWDEAVAPQTLERWLRVDREDPKPCVYWDAPGDAGAATCPNAESDVLAKLHSREFGIDCRDRTSRVAMAALEEPDSCHPIQGTPQCELTLRQDDCKPTDAADQVVKVAALRERGPSPFCADGVLHGATSAHVKLPTAGVDSRGAFDALPTVEACVAHAEGLTLEWRRGGSASERGFVSMEAPLRAEGRTHLPIPTSAERLSFSFHRASDKREVGSLTCARPATASCIELVRITTTDLRVAKLAMTSAVSSTFEPASDVADADDDVWACTAPKGGCAASGPEDVASVALSFADVAELSSDRVPASVTFPAGRAPRKVTMHRKGTATLLGTLTCNAPPDAEVVAELVSVNAAVKRGDLVATGPGWSSEWRPARHGDPKSLHPIGTAWICRPRAVAVATVRWDDRPADFVAGSSTVTTRHPPPACRKCAPNTSGRMTDRCWKNDDVDQRPSSCTAEWLYCRCL